MIGKRAKQGAGFGLELPVDIIFYGDSRVTIWFKKASEKLNNSLNVEVEKCV